MEKERREKQRFHSLHIFENPEIIIWYDWLDFSVKIFRQIITSFDLGDIFSVAHTWLYQDVSIWSWQGVWCSPVVRGEHLPSGVSPLKGPPGLAVQKTQRQPESSRNCWWPVSLPTAACSSAGWRIGLPTPPNAPNLKTRDLIAMETLLTSMARP